MGYTTTKYKRKFMRWLVDLVKKKAKQKVAQHRHNLPASLPRTVEEFLSIRDQMAASPQGGAVCFILALINYADPDPAIHAEGVAMMIISMCEENIVSAHEGAPESYKGYVLHRSDAERLARVTDYLARSYVTGATPDNQYSINDPSSISIAFRHQTEYTGSEADGSKKVFIWSNGADTARPVSLKRNAKGFWKVNEFSSITVGIRPPNDPSCPPAAEAL
eukprot:jgi/Picsp_1/3555/NSC_06393-R1_conserved domain protein